MINIKTSIYFYLFNAKVREFDLDGTIKNFTDFADEVVCATIKSEDDTYERLKEWENKLGPEKFRVVMSDIDINKSNRWDGELKSIALQNCSKSTPDIFRVYIIADADERFVLSNKNCWMAAAELLSQKTSQINGIDGFLIPVLDLQKNEKSIRADANIGFKFRMHRDTIVKRGVLPEAEMGDGLFNTSLSDSTEPLTKDGVLGQFVPYVNNYLALVPHNSYLLVNNPYVFHYGHLDQERRLKLNREFWREHWKNRSGNEPDMPLIKEQISEFYTVEHNLPLI